VRLLDCYVDLALLPLVARHVRTELPTDKSGMTMLKLHLEILKHPLRGFEVRVVDSDGRTHKMFRYPNY
jgi:hypothetical protein